MNSASDFDLQQIYHNFAFLVDHHGFEVDAPRINGDVARVAYRHPDMIVEFTVHHGEWQAWARPSSPTKQMHQVSLQAIIAYLARPPIDFAADQAQPGLMQHLALAQVAGELAPLAGRMVALFQPAGWTEAWQDLQAVLAERRAERERQFTSWWRQRGSKPTLNWQDAPDLSAAERQVAEALKAAAEAMLAIPEEERTRFANPDKFFGPIGLPDDG